MGKFTPSRSKVAGQMSLKGQADAAADEAGFGQLWVDSDDNNLYFTNESGDDVKLTNGDEIAAAAGASVAADDINVGDNNITIQGGTGHSLTLNANAAQAQLKTTSSGEIDIDSAANIDISAATGLTMDSTTLSIDSTDTTNLTMTANAASTKTMTISATNSNGSGRADLDIVCDGVMEVSCDDIVMRSSTSQNPMLTLKNTENDQNGAFMMFHKAKDSGGVGADGDIIGTIRFKAEDDGGTAEKFADIRAIVDTAANGSEIGKFQFQVYTEGDSGSVVVNGVEIKGSTTSGVVDLNMMTDGSSINFGADSEIKLTHVADSGLVLKHNSTTDGTFPKLTFQTGDNAIIANNILGQIDFQAPDDSGADSDLVGASLVAIAEGTFSDSSNATSLQFRTGASETATTKMTLDSAGLLTCDGGVKVGNITIKEDQDGENNDLVMSTNPLNIKSGGGITFEAANDIIFRQIGGGEEIVFRGLEGVNCLRISQAIEGASHFNNGAGDTVVAIDDGDQRLYFYDIGGEYIVSDGDNFSMVSGGALTLDADGDVISLKFGGAAGQLDFTNANSGDVVVQSKVDSKDLVFQQYDGNEVLRLTDSKVVKIGGDTQLGSGAAPYLGLQDAGIVVSRNSNDSVGGELIFAKSRNATDGSHTVVQEGDVIGEMVFQGSDGDSLEAAAKIAVKVDAAPGDGDMPGTIVFSTTADGANSPTERMSIDSNGIFHIGAPGGVATLSRGTFSKDCDDNDPTDFVNFTVPNANHFASLKLFGHFSFDNGTKGKTFELHATIRRGSGAATQFTAGSITSLDDNSSGFTISVTAAVTSGTNSQTQVLALKLTNDDGAGPGQGPHFGELMVEMLNSKASGITMAPA